MNAWLLSIWWAAMAGRPETAGDAASGMETMRRTVQREGRPEGTPVRPAVM